MYIPLMAFTTYVLLSTLIAGLNGQFKPELLGITVSNASVIVLLELVLLWLGRYFLNIHSESQIYGMRLPLSICLGGLAFSFFD